MDNNIPKKTKESAISKTKIKENQSCTFKPETNET